MKNTVVTMLLTAAFSLWLLPLAQAEDTPSNMGPGLPEQLVTARAAIAAKDWPRALAELKGALKVEPRNADVHNLLGYSHRKQARPDLAKAFEHYKLALQIDPGHKGAHEYIGEAYLMDQRPDEAEKHLAELARLCGNKTCEEYLDLDEAIKAYKATLPR
jgi:tetratricopeptide (TPR) repeat protein